MAGTGPLTNPTSSHGEVHLQEHLAFDGKTRWLLDAVPEAIVVVSGRGPDPVGEPAHRRDVRLREGELLGRELEILLPERYRGGHSGYRASYFAEPGMRTMGAGRDLTGRHKDGSEFPVEIGLNYVNSGEGMLAVGLVSDITERKKAEAELARVNAELRRSNTDLGQFAYVASHDLQEPLRMITGYLQLLERRYKDKLDVEACEFIRYAVEGSIRMKRLIEDLLALSRAGTKATNIRPLESRDLFEIACANLAVAIKESEAKITSDPLPRILADSGLLTQVFQNLIGNAIKFRAKFGRPHIHVSASTNPDGCNVFSREKDNGIGIEARHLERIFGIFERLHSGGPIQRLRGWAGDCAKGIGTAWWADLGRIDTARRWIYVFLFHSGPF